MVKPGHGDRLRHQEHPSPGDKARAGHFAAGDQGGHHDGGDSPKRGVFLELSIEIAPVHSGHDDIQQNGVRLEFERFAEGQVRIVAGLDLVVSGAFEAELEQSGECRLVVDEKQALAESDLMTRGGNGYVHWLKEGQGVVQSREKGRIENGKRSCRMKGCSNRNYGNYNAPRSNFQGRAAASSSAGIREEPDTNPTGPKRIASDSQAPSHAA